MYFVDRIAVRVEPTQKFLSWLNEIEEKNPEGMGITLTLEQIKSNASIYLVPDADTPEDVITYLDDCYETIFEAELSSWYLDKSLWPEDRSLKEFWTFFDIEVHDTVLDLVEEDI